ncbi:MAG: hypothetical protein KJ593_00355 [Candidatus Omnitrophica bacterium]|nr:hypothetical protein [Candidatus Omnitrophota bacterium]
MTEKLKDLLEKINEEGVKQAEEAARRIESKAEDDAEKILRDAKSQAEAIIDDARSHARKVKEAGELALKQSGRNLMLSLKEEIRSLLNKIIGAETAKIMSAVDLEAILEKLIINFAKEKGETSDIKVLLKQEDLAKLKKTFILRLKERLKEPIEFRPAANINTGFSISFDKGKSFFDFTDEGLAEAIRNYLNPELARIFK